MSVGTTKELGMVIRARRKELGITQMEVALTCGTGLRFIVDLEKGKLTCQIGKTLNVLQSLGLAVEIAALGRADIGGGRP